eukprot:gb/GFBE01055005.1/.p1 GENE.gb/GFBE01055005.1/~~gb/GFBE01055005.1/.p1  ORF type:complete len:185 (+),score=22.52 gb/GFBE01055005.1/:1-555(+)
MTKAVLCLCVLLATPCVSQLRGAPRPADSDTAAKLTGSVTEELFLRNEVFRPADTALAKIKEDVDYVEEEADYLEDEGAEPVAEAAEEERSDPLVAPGLGQRHMIAAGALRALVKGNVTEELSASLVATGACANVYPCSSYCRCAPGGPPGSGWTQWVCDGYGAGGTPIFCANNCENCQGLGSP